MECEGLIRSDDAVDVVCLQLAVLERLNYHLFVLVQAHNARCDAWPAFAPHPLSCCIVCRGTWQMGRIWIVDASMRPAGSVFGRWACRPWAAAGGECRLGVACRLVQVVFLKGRGGREVVGARWLLVVVGVGGSCWWSFRLPAPPEVNTPPPRTIYRRGEPDVLFGDIGDRDEQYQRLFVRQQRLHRWERDLLTPAQAEERWNRACECFPEGPDYHSDWGRWYLALREATHELRA